MKITKTIALLLISIALFSACKKKESDPEPEPTPAPVINGSMTATLNGNSWTSIKNSAEFLIDD
ncbi:MAG TPA: hypothetical protein PL029_08910, partial [Bacteroidia bacterium]|nr:hypothetical protein [Bacteroidia bacterium]